MKTVEAYLLAYSLTDIAWVTKLGGLNRKELGSSMHYQLTSFVALASRLEVVLNGYACHTRKKRYALDYMEYVIRQLRPRQRPDWVNQSNVFEID